MIDGLLIIERQAKSQSSYGTAELAQIAERINLLSPPMDTDAVLAGTEALAKAEVMFCGWGAPKFDQAFLERAPRLKAVFYAGGSVRSVVSPAFWARGIRITSGYAMNGVAVADYATGIILIGLKHGFLHARYARENGRHSRKLPVPGAYESTVGIISLGAAGKALLQRLRGFDMKVIAHDPYVPAQEATKLGVELVGLDEIFARADAISLHTPQLPETIGLIHRRHFECMKPGAIFINTARGAIVREHEMIEVLQQRTDLMAVLDVSDPEPPVDGSPLYSMPNVMLTPHIAGALGRERLRLGRCMIEEFDRWQRGEAMQWEITQKSIVHLA